MNRALQAPGIPDRHGSLLIGIAALLTGVNGIHVVRELDESLQAVVFGGLVPLACSLFVVAFTWLMLGDVWGETVPRRIVTWSAGGVVSGVAAGVFFLLYQAAEGGQLSDPQFIPGMIASYGAAIGLVIGHYETRAWRERDRAESTRREMRTLKRAVEQAGDAVYVTDASNNIEYVNPAFEEITGYDAEEVRGRDPKLLQSEATPPSHYASLWSTVQRGEVFEEEILNQRKSGDRYHGRQTIAPVTDDEGTIEHYVAIQRDITDLKERERYLDVVDRVLRHTLRNKLNVIMTSARLLQSDDDASAAAAADRIIDTSKQLLTAAELNRSIADLLTSNPDPMVQDLAETCETVVAERRGAHPEATIALEVSGPLRVNALPQLPDAIRELLDNSLEHTDSEDPHISVCIEASGDTACLSIADNGPGLPDIERDLFDVDSQIDSMRHSDGLGLWFVYHVLSLSEGSIEFPDDDVEATVELCIPLADGETAS